MFEIFVECKKFNDLTKFLKKCDFFEKTAFL